MASRRTSAEIAESNARYLADMRRRSDISSQENTLLRFLGVPERARDIMFGSHPMDKIFAYLRGENVGYPSGHIDPNPRITRYDIVINYLGIIIPQRVPQRFLQRTREQYVDTVLVDYAHILTRGSMQVKTISELASSSYDMKLQYFHRLKDTEIFETLGIHIVHFIDRRDLIRRVIGLFEGENLFFCDRSSPEYSLNPIPVTTNQLIGIGTLQEHFTYTLQQLLDHLALDEEHNQVVFRDGDVEDFYTIEDLSALSVLAQDARQDSARNPEAYELEHKVRSFIDILRARATPLPSPDPLDMPSTPEPSTHSAYSPLRRSPVSSVSSSPSSAYGQTTPQYTGSPVY